MFTNHALYGKIVYVVINHGYKDKRKEVHVMKKFKKALLVSSAVLVVALSAVGCKKTTDCEMCGEEKKCSKVKYEGEEAWLCESCEDLFNALKGYMD